MAFNIVLYAYAIIGHTRANQLLPQLLIEQFEFIIFVCTDSTEIFLSKLRSPCSNYKLPSFFTDSYCAGGI